MPKVICKCENVIGLAEIPSPNQWMVISDAAYDGFQGQVDAELLYSKMNMIVKCDVCNRLHIFWDGFDKSQTIYREED